MADLAPTRRAMLAGIAAVPALAVAGCPAPAPAAVTDSGLDAAIAAFRAAEAASTAHCTNVYYPAQERSAAAVAAIPHRSTASSYMALRDMRMKPSTRDEASVVSARSFVARLDAGERAISADHERTMRELVTLADERDAAVEQARLASGIKTAGERSDELFNAVGDAADRVLAVAPATLAELSVKLSFLLDDLSDDLDHCHVQIIASDVRRLAGAA